MLKQEFIDLTGFVPCDALYEQIEKEYMSSEEDKQAFCERYKEDISLQTRIADAADKKHREEIESVISTNDSALSRIGKLRKEIRTLEQKLDKEQEWEPVVDDGSVSDAEYAALYDDCNGLHGTVSGQYVVSDEAAKDTLHRYFGFDPEMVRIFHKAWKYEKNRHGVLRRTELTDRRPIHFSSDMNYYLFDCGAYTYEVWNGELSLYKGYSGEV